MTSLSAPRTFTNSKATAAAYDHGAHVTSWTPSGLDPVLWMSNRSQLEAANVLDDAITLAPGASHTMTYTLSFEAL